VFVPSPKNVILITYSATVPFLTDMTEAVVNKIERAMEAAGGLYHSLVLLVGTSGSGKTALLRMIAKRQQASLINVNFHVTSKLLELTPKQRKLQLPEILNQVTQDIPALLVLDNLEVLFDGSLKQDPLRLLQGMSRNRTVVASWNGKVQAGNLIYAEPGHPEYRRLDADGVLTVDFGDE